MKYFQLFIDESGTADPKHQQSKLYVLCGCSVLKSDKAALREYAGHLKYKYWGKTEVVFHSKALQKNEEDFQVFARDPALKKAFLKDLFKFLRAVKFRIFVIVVDKSKAKNLRWDRIKVFKESSRKLVYHYSMLLLSARGRGRMFVESSSEKDLHYLNAFNYYIGPHKAPPAEDYTKIRKALTSVSFVTKQNHDIEEQIADLFAYAARIKYEADILKKKPKAGSYENIMLAILNQKMWVGRGSFSSNSRAKLRRNIQAFCVLPK